MAKVGRPKAEKPKTKRFSIRLDDETQEQLRAYCERHDISQGEAVRQALQLLLDKK